MKVIVHSGPDGGVTVTVPVEPMREGETGDGYIARIAGRAVPRDAVDIMVCEDSDIPQDRTFRGAWRLAGGKVVVDMPLARAIKLERIRAERNRRLEATDKDVAKLDGDPVPASLKARRQALRDLPQTIQAELDAIDQPATLKLFEPNWPV